MRAALSIAWEASGRACGKRLKPLLPGLLTTLVKEGRLPRDPILRGKLLRISAATIDRLLRPVRAKNAVSLVEQRLDNVRESLWEIARFSIPDDLEPDERRSLEVQYQRLVDDLRRFAPVVV